MQGQLEATRRQLDEISQAKESSERTLNEKNELLQDRENQLSELRDRQANTQRELESTTNSLNEAKTKSQELENRVHELERSSGEQSGDKDREIAELRSQIENLNNAKQVS